MKTVSPTNSPAASSAPSGGSRLMKAALSGLLGAGAVACGGDNGEPDPCTPIDAGQSALPDSGPPVDTGTMTVDSSTTPDAGTADSGYVQTGSEPGEKTYEQLAELCRMRNGYIQVHGSCSGVNACAGFSYGDWGEDATLTEHTCAGMNGCVGLSCVYMAPDQGRTGQQVYEEAFPQPGPYRCGTCHAPSEYDDTIMDYRYDHTIFQVKVTEDSTVTPESWTSNWTAAQMERMVAFGVNGFDTESGEATAHMASYRKLLSRREIEALIEYLRGFPTNRVQMGTFSRTGSRYRPDGGL